MAAAVPGGGTARRDVAAPALPVVAAVLPMALTGALSPFLRQALRLTEAEFGSAVAVFFCASALLSVPGGLLTHRLGARRATRLALLVTALSLVGIGMWAASWHALAACLLLGGIGNGIAQPAANLALTERVAAARQGLAHGVKQAAVPAAALLAGVAVPVAAVPLGWRATYVLAALAPMAIVVRLRSRASSAARGPVATATWDRPMLRPLLLLAVAAGFGNAAAVSLSAFLVEAATSAGLSPAQGGLLLAAGSAAGMLARLLVGWSADRRADGHLHVVAVLLAVGAAAFGLLAAGGTTPVLLVLGALAGFAAGWGWPGLLNYAVIGRNAGAAAAVAGVLQAGGATGGIVGPAVFGQLVTRHSFAAAWALSAVLAAAAAGLVLAGSAVVRSRVTS